MPFLKLELKNIWNYVEKKYQVKPIVYGHGIYKKKGRN